MVLAVPVGRVHDAHPWGDRKSGELAKALHSHRPLILLHHANPNIAASLGQLTEIAGHGCLQAEPDQKLGWNGLLRGDGCHQAADSTGLLRIVDERQRRDSVAGIA